MELVYCWGKNYASLSNIDINFNPKFSFEFDEDSRTLIFNEHESSINVFSHVYANIVSVTALVGENGAGKTSFIHFLLDCFNIELSRGFGNVEIPYILIFYKNDSFIVYDNLPNAITTKSMSPKYTFSIVPKATSTLLRQNPPMCVVHYTNAFSFSAYRDTFPYVVSSQLYDISFSKLLREKEEHDLTPDPIMNAYHRATKRQVAAWGKWEIPSFPCPDLYMHMSTAGRGYYVVKEYIESNWKSGDIGKDSSKEKLLLICQRITEKHNFTGRGIMILQGLVYSLVQWILTDISWKNEERDIAIAKITEEWEELWNDQTQLHDTDYIVSFAKATFRNFKGGEEVHEEIIKSYSFVVDALLNEKFVDYYEQMSVFRIKKGYEKIGLSAFYDNYLIAIASFNDFIIFDWGMSTGEFARFDLFSHIVELGGKANVADQNKRCSQDSFLFILDEIDLYLHPRWQQSFLNDLLKDLVVLFPNQTVQIIFSTHSPIFLSDMPDDNVFYFEKRKDGNLFIKKDEKKTFATNIYNLYQNSFFLKKNLGFMGDFSYKVLSDIHDEWEKILSSRKKISKDDSSYKRIRTQWGIVNKIGEPILRNMFQKMYIEVMKAVTSTEGTLLNEYEIIMEFISQLPKKKQEDMVSEIIKKTGL